MFIDVLGSRKNKALKSFYNDEIRAYLTLFSHLMDSEDEIDYGACFILVCFAALFSFFTLCSYIRET